MENDKSNVENDLNSEAQPKVQSDGAENTLAVMDHTGDKNEKSEKINRVDDLDNKNNEKTDVETGMDMVHADDGLQSLGEITVTKDQGDIVSTQVESFKVVQEVSLETTVRVSEESGDGSNQDPSSGEPKPESLSPEQERSERGSSDLISDKQVVER
ncbi:hypothetical protein L1987_74555 [Smallanthus sonchifolius]|uniref:Uncharacterized protein n=1 Tax=Smallanthus sonchifolius TaxID=185202 RepID=A0ACB9A3D1_9ASTR|nr:hypothetical protein L1987_74555 [Smallanthus sonchifolius]